MFELTFWDSSTWLPVAVFNIRIALLFGVVFIFTWVFKSATAAWRHVLWMTAFGALILLPLAGRIAPQWHIGLLPAPSPSQQELIHEPFHPAPASLAAESVEPSIPQTTLVPNTASHESSVTPAPVASSLRLSIPLGLLLWMFGFSLLMSRVVFGTLRLRRIKQQSQELIDDNALHMLIEEKRRFQIRVPIEVYLSSEITSPLTAGWTRPVIVLPSHYHTLSAQKRRTILLHELAHIKRRDTLWQALVHLATAVFWFNPMVWMAAKRCTLEREQACDELVLHHSERPSDYAHLLLEFAELKHQMALSGITMAGHSQLEGRLLSILSNKRTFRPLSRATIWKTAITTLALVLMVGTFTPVSDAQPNRQILDSPHEALILESLSLAVHDRDDDVREEAIKTLGRIKSAKATQLLYDALNSEDADDQIRAAKLLLKRGETEAISSFTRDLQHEEPDARERAAKILRKIAHPTTLPALVQALHDEHAEVREEVARAIAELRTSEVIPPLSEALQDSDTDVREIAAWGLGEAKDPAALPLLFAALNDPEAKVRKAAIESIGDIRVSQSAVHIHALIHDHNRNVRREAVKVLEELRAPASVPVLIEALRDEYYKVREQAAEALGEFRDPRAIVPLSAALHDKSDNVRKEAANALGNYYNEE